MKVFISKIDKNNDTLVERYIYKGNSTVVSLGIWEQLMKDRYKLNKTAFRSIWFKYTNSGDELYSDSQLKIDLLKEQLNKINIHKLESFLEKIWIKYKFIINISK